MRSKSNIAQTVELLKQHFFSRKDRIAFLAPWGKPHPTIQTDNLDELLEAHVFGSSAPKAAVHYTSRKGGHKVTKGRFRIGSYVPAPDGTTPWLCVDFDAGEDHADALADPDAAIIRAYEIFSKHALPVYLERSGGGLGWHLWCFFKSGIKASKVRKLAHQLLPTDIPLAQGGFAKPSKAKGIEIFPKQDKLNKNGLGNLVWLPWWSEAKGDGNQFFLIEEGNSFVPFLPETFEQIDTETLDKVVVATAKKKSKSEPSNQPANSNDAWKTWRRNALASLRLEDIYGSYLTGNSSGDGWLECRDPSSPTGDINPSAGVADGSNSVERGSFHSFISGQTISVFDFMIEQGQVTDLKRAIIKIADLSRVPLPKSSSTNRRNSIRGLPEIQINMRQLRDIIDDTWNAVHLANNKNIPIKGDKPILFNRAGSLVRIIRKQVENQDHEAFIRTQLDVMNDVALYGLLARIATWHRSTDNGPIDSMPLRDVARDMPEYPDPTLPPIDSIVTAPLFNSSGKLINTPGYHRGESLWYEPDKELGQISVPLTPSKDDIEHARSIILDEVLVDFPFKTKSDQAHMVAALVLPFARRLISGCTPVHLFEASSPGSGKGLLCSIISRIATGNPTDSRTLPSQEDEARKMITAELSLGRPIILLDNTSERKKLDSTPLASVVTAETWTDRLLGQSDMLTFPNRAMWMVTGNNPKMTLEIARRCIRIRLEPEMDEPWLRGDEEFKHGKLIDWVMVHRTQLVSAILTLIQSWIAANRPASRRNLGSFENWSNVIGGILENAGINGFLDNVKDLYEDADEETRSWRNFANAWWDEFKDEPKRASDLNEFCESKELLNAARGDKSAKSQQIRLAKALGKNRDRVFNKLRLVRVNEDTKRNGMFYSLIPVDEDKKHRSSSRQNKQQKQMGMFSGNGECSGNVCDEYSHTSNTVVKQDSGNNGNVGNVSTPFHARDHAHTRTHAHESDPDHNIPHIPTNGEKSHQNYGSGVGMCDENIPDTFPNIPTSDEFDLADLPEDFDGSDSQPP